MWNKIIKLTRAEGKRVLRELLQVFINMFRFVNYLLNIEQHVVCPE